MKDNSAERILKEAVESREVAGINLLVQKDGRDVIYAQAGYADAEKKKEYGRDTIVRLYSMTKPVTAAAVMLLMERGELDLCEPAESFLPGFRNVQVWEEGRKVPARRSVRVRDLLSMTSGLPYGGNPASPSSVEVQKIFEEIDEKLYREDSLSTVEIANRIGQCGLLFHPGDSWEYGVSADVLGAIVEIVSGKRFGEFLKEELLDPLGMEDTGFYVPKEKQERLACVYEKRGVELKLYKGDHLGIMNAQKKKPAFESGGAGMVSTLEDYSRFAAMLLNGGEYGGKQILRPDTVNYMTGGKLLPWQQEAMWKKWETLSGFGYGNLMRIMVEPGMAYHQGVKGEYGWDGWLGAYFCNIPSEKISILLSFQRAGTGTIGVTRKLRNLLTPGYIRGEG